jgi:uncharacterized protein
VPILQFATIVAVAGQFEDALGAYQRRDYATSLRLFQSLADKGSARAMFYLGLMHDRGQGVSQNSNQAAVWFRRAAERGDVVSASSLASYYFSGDGVPQSYSEAIKWFSIAAKGGDAAAQSSLGMFYKRGYGMPQNFILAYMWYAVAAHDPNYESLSQRDIKEIAPHLAPSQIEEAKRLAQRCLQSSYSDCN